MSEANLFAAANGSHFFAFLSLGSLVSSLPVFENQLRRANMDFLANRPICLVSILVISSCPGDQFLIQNATFNLSHTDVIRHTSVSCSRVLVDFLSKLLCSLPSFLSGTWRQSTLCCPSLSFELFAIVYSFICMLKLLLIELYASLVILRFVFIWRLLFQFHFGSVYSID